MFLQEIFDQLTFGELSHIKFGGGEAGTLAEADWPRVLTHINLGLTDLYTRFPLKENRVVLSLIVGQDDYSLHSKYAVANTKSREAVRHLLDTTALPFTDDILKIEQVITNPALATDERLAWPLNNPAEPLSIHTPTSTTLRLPSNRVALTAGGTTTLTLVYRARHAKLKVGNGLFNPETKIIELPDAYLNAILLFIAARAYAPMGTVGKSNMGNEYAMKYVLECQRLTTVNVHVDQTGGHNRNFEGRGWA